jgi:hypothetical protein
LAQIRPGDLRQSELDARKALYEALRSACIGPDEDMLPSRALRVSPEPDSSPAHAAASAHRHACALGAQRECAVSAHRAGRVPSKQTGSDAAIEVVFTGDTQLNRSCQIICRM